MKKLALTVLVLVSVSTFSFGQRKQERTFRGQIMESTCASMGGHSPGGYAATHTHTPTLLDFADHGAVGRPLPASGAGAARGLAMFASAGIDCERLAIDLQREGAEAFVKSWNELLACINSKSELKAAGLRLV